MLERGISGNSKYMGRDEGMDTPRAEYEEAVMAHPPMGDDLHNHINAIGEIDSKIEQLRKRRQQMVEAFQMKMEEIGKHYSDVVDGPRESDGRY